MVCEIFLSKSDFCLDEKEYLLIFVGVYKILMDYRDACHFYPLSDFVLNHKLINKSVINVFVY